MPNQPAWTHSKDSMIQLVTPIKHQTLKVELKSNQELFLQTSFITPKLRLRKMGELRKQLTKQLQLSIKAKSLKRV
jgi:hypothetical protein